MNKRRRELIEQIWRSSNLTVQEAEKIVDDAIRLGQFMGWEQGLGNNGDSGSVAA
jgi:hypothetical protein